MVSHYSIIIPCHNHLDLTVQCLRSIERNSNMKSLEIILINDGSTDGTNYWQRSFDNSPNISYIYHPSREGFTKSCNEGMEKARGDYIVLLNNDTLVTPDWLQHLENSLLEARRRYKNPNFHMVGPVSNDVPGMQQVKVAFDPQNLDDFGEKYYQLNKGKLKPALFLSGFCLMFTRQLYQKIEGFDERFSPGGYEDSLTKDRPIIIKDSFENIRIITIEELFHQYSQKIKHRQDGKEEIILNGLQTLSFSHLKESEKTLTEIQKYALAKKKSGYTVAEIAKEKNVDWDIVKDYLNPQTSDLDKYDVYGKWTNIKKIIRHKINRMVHRINQPLGSTEVTPDHSIMYINNRGQLIPGEPQEFLHKNLIVINILPKISIFNEIDLIDHLDTTELDYDNNFIMLKKREKNRLGKRIPNQSKVKIIRKLKREKLEAFLRLTAAYISEGCYTEAYGYMKQAHITSTDINWLKEKQEDLNSLFIDNSTNINCSNHISSGIHYRNKPTYRLMYPGKISAIIFKQLCGSGAISKKIPNFIYHLPRDYITIFLQTLKEGDGLILSQRSFPRSRKEYRKTHFKYFSSSEMVIAGLSFLLTKLNRKFTINSKMPSKSSWSKTKKLAFSIEECFRHSTREPRRKKTWRKYNDYVYDLVLEDSHIFADACGLVLVHNTDLCLRARLAGFLSVISLDTFIYHHGHRTIDEFPELDRGHINRWKYFEKWRDDKPKKLVAMYYVKDTKHLRQSLESINDAVDEIIVFDSSHKAESITRDFQKVVICQDAPLGKALKKENIPQILLNLAHSGKPDWLLTMSENEVIEGFTRDYAEKLMNPIIPDIMGWEASEFITIDPYECFIPQRHPRIAMYRALPNSSPEFPIPPDSIRPCPMRIKSLVDYPAPEQGCTLIPRLKDEKIALVTIMKDEAKYLDSFLEAIYGVFDEIVLVDTGSRDSSKELAERWGARVSDFKWKDHFSIARNFALGQTNAEFILQLDIDEKLEDVRKVYEMVNSGKDAFLFTIADLHPGGRMAFPESIRLFRKMEGVHYEGMIHETVIESLTKIPTLKMDRATTRIVHYGRLRPGAKDRIKYYQELVENGLRKNQNDPLLHFHQALMDRDAKDMESALRHMQQAARAGWNKPNIRLELANMHLQAAYVVYQTLKDIDPGHPYYEEIMKKLQILRQFFP